MTNLPYQDEVVTEMLEGEIVEFLSSKTAKKDRGYKRDLYERCGVKEY